MFFWDCKRQSIHVHVCMVLHDNEKIKSQDSVNQTLKVSFTLNVCSIKLTNCSSKGICKLTVS